MVEGRVEFLRSNLTCLDETNLEPDGRSGKVMMIVRRSKRGCASASVSSRRTLVLAFAPDSSPTGTGVAWRPRACGPILPACTRRRRVLATLRRGSFAGWGATLSRRLPTTMRISMSVVCCRTSARPTWRRVSQASFPRSASRPKPSSPTGVSVWHPCLPPSARRDTSPT